MICIPKLVLEIQDLLLLATVLLPRLEDNFSWCVQWYILILLCEFVYASHHVNWYILIHTSIWLIRIDIHYFVYPFYMCTNPFVSFYSVITVLTMILIMQTKMMKKMRMIATKERVILMTGNQLGHLFAMVLKIMKMCLMFMLTWTTILKRRVCQLMSLICWAILWTSPGSFQ